MEYRGTFSRTLDEEYDKREVPSFIEARPPLVTNPFQRRQLTKKKNLLEEFDADAEVEEEQPELLQVYLRVKPYKGSNNLYELRDNQSLITYVDTVTAGHGRRTQNNLSKIYSFSHIFSPDTSQKAIFDHIVKANLRKLALEGQSYTLLAYGASGSGKTYTLMGTEACPGLIPRSLEYVFKVVDAAQQPLYKPCDGSSEELSYTRQESEMQFVKKLRHLSAPPVRDKYRRMSACLTNDFAASTMNLTDKTHYYVWVSFVEIYNEAVYDLLVPPDRRAATKLKIREDSTGQVYVEGAKQAFVRSGSEAYEVMVAGKHNLQVAETGVHAHSSRSHCIFTITMLADTPDGMRTSCVRLCDLAGSERANRTRNTGARMAESRAINTSLHVLERCLHTLRRKQRLRADANLVPYRESKLTRLLGSGLSGMRGEPVTMLVTVNPAPEYVHETKHVLQLAAVAKDIQINYTMSDTSSQINSTQDSSASGADLMNLRVENERLQFELVQLMSTYKELQATMEQQQEENTRLMQEVVDEVKDMNKEYYESQIKTIEERHKLEMDEVSEELQTMRRSFTVMNFKMRQILKAEVERNRDSSRIRKLAKTLLACLDDVVNQSVHNDYLEESIEETNETVLNCSNHLPNKKSFLDTVSITETISSDGSPYVKKTSICPDKEENNDSKRLTYDVTETSVYRNEEESISDEITEVGEADLSAAINSGERETSKIDVSERIERKNKNENDGQNYNEEKLYPESIEKSSTDNNSDDVSDLKDSAFNDFSGIDSDTNIQHMDTNEHIKDADIVQVKETENIFRKIKLRDLSNESSFKESNDKTIDGSLAQFEKYENEANMEANSLNSERDEIQPLNDINIFKEKRTYFDNIKENICISKKITEVDGNSTDFRSPSIVKEEIPSDYNPATIKKLLGDSIVRVSECRSLLAAKQEMSLDIFEEINSPQIQLQQGDKANAVNNKKDALDKSIDKMSIFNDFIEKNKEKGEYFSYGPVTQLAQTTEIELSSNKAEMKEHTTKNKQDLSESHLINFTASVENNTVEDFEKIFKDISVPRSTEFDMLLSQDSINPNVTQNDPIVDKDKEQNILALEKKRKYNLRHKQNEEEKVQTIPPNDENTAPQTRTKPKPALSLRLRRRKNEDSEKLKTIENLQNEFCDVIMDKPAPLKQVIDISSPEKETCDEGNMRTEFGIQSCPAKSAVMLRSRRKLFTPRAEPLEESLTAAGDSNERPRVLRPSYHRGRARRKL